MGLALHLAKRGYGRTSPNPMVGAVLVKEGQVLGRGWHHRAGQPHAEIEALRDAQARGMSSAGATLYLTLEPCSTEGRTPPCTRTLLQSGLARVCVGATDPNPKHAGRGYQILREAGVSVLEGIRADEATRLNETFNYWIVHQRPFVTVKAAMSLDGKIATVSGQSRWITGTQARARGLRIRRGADAILVGVKTILADDPNLTARRGERATGQTLRRIVLDSQARIPPDARVLSDASAPLTTIVVTDQADPVRVSELTKRAEVLVAPGRKGQVNLEWLLAELGRRSVTHLLVEGGGEVNAAFLLGGYTHRVVLFYAPIILGGQTATSAVGGAGAALLSEAIRLQDIQCRRLGRDFLLTGRVGAPQAHALAC
jgi:diaminohydroxyphosphoribosylaminopyrimidine deaminase/5-amino-6-(5-phosphoribosylamino)uracil reductase